MKQHKFSQLENSELPETEQYIESKNFVLKKNSFILRKIKLQKSVLKVPKKKPAGGYVVLVNLTLRDWFEFYPRLKSWSKKH